MLFNSLPFLFGFLPLTFALFYAAGRRYGLSKVVLTVLSLGFYAWWRPAQLPILLWSIVFNYVVGAIIQRAYAQGQMLRVSAWLAFGLLADLALLGWFKYANFVVDNVDLVFGVGIHLGRIALPLAISFFTFQKLAYLIDSARGEAKPMSFLDFSLFAAFFPQLIAGPIVHYAQVVPQLQSRRFGRLVGSNVLVGIVMFAMGLFKKTVIADTLANYANPLFDAAAKQHGLGLAPAWVAAITFALQLYFDFSGYSDMAIGLGRVFGVRLPLNFHSPLRAASIIDYWRRWHMTLQRFIVAYIYQPLSLPLTRFAAQRGLSAWPTFLLAGAIPSFVTFVVVGIWHGAGWTYVLFGVMHAIYICVNQAWREGRALKRRAWRKLKRALPEPGRIETVVYAMLTLLAVVLSDVMFRARTVGDALAIWRSMVWPNGASLSAVPWVFGPDLAAALAVSLFVVFLMPNTQQIMGRFNPAYNWSEWKDVGAPAIRWRWAPSAWGLVFAGVTLFLGIAFIERGQAIFLYFNF